MIEAIPENLTSLLIGSFIVYGITFLYSIYMAILNHKQAKVKDLVEEQNKILKEILMEIQLKKL